jgi:hypothetical protein
MKPLFLLFLMIYMHSLSVFAQSNSFGDDSSIQDLLYKGTRPGAVIYEEENYNQPPFGQVMIADWKNLQTVSEKIAELLASAPNDATGKQSSWYGQIQTWRGLFDQCLASKTQADLFALIPTMAEYAGREDGTRTLSAQMESIEGEMRGMGYYVIRAMANHVTEQQAAVSPTNLNGFVKIFAVPGFVAEGDWEDEKIPVNAAGVMILDAASVVTQLKTGPWQQAKKFLGGATTANGFFSRYFGTGDGLAVLKTKYAANQLAIAAKFGELKAWADQQ